MAVDIIDQFPGDECFPIARGLRVGIEAAVVKRERVRADENHLFGSACRDSFFRTRENRETDVGSFYLLPAFPRRGGREADGAVGNVREALRLFEVTNRPVCAS